ncbi:MAG TPA: CaiB/BaiF CoA-transferase family protein [Gemmatimonadales bacterium]|nr:CaiB/BaiF CoA-transferase family protein [Gemmatimonadales bacterium]
MPGALAQLRVLDLSRVLAGPWASQILADLGADVIKVERPGAGDDTRHWGPPYLKDASGRETGEAAYYLSANRGKRSLTVDFTRAEGRDIVRRLALQSDVLLENHKVGDLARHGLAWDDLRVVNPRLIYCSITGFGQTGPYARRAGYDFAIQAIGGLMSVTGERDGLPGGGPQKVGVAVADVMAGLYATIGILAALAARSVTGAGQHVDLALLDVQVATLANVALNYLVSGNVPQRWGNAHANIAPYQVLPTVDRPIVLAIGNDAQFVKFCEVAAAPGLARDPRFATNAARVTNRDALTHELEIVLHTRTAAGWLAALEPAGVPCAPINDLAQVFADPQVRHRGLRLDAAHPSGATVPMVANPIRLSATPAAYDLAPPVLGQHTEEILSERLGMTAEQIAELRRMGVV